MGIRLRSKLTYANVMATIAVFIALGGGAYAATKINGKTIVKESIVGKKLKKNTVTGTQVKESSLGQVPSAASASNATSASNADRLNGLASSAFLPANGTATNASKLGGKEPSSFLTQGSESAKTAGYGLGALTDLATLDVAVGTEPHHVLILGSSDLWSFNGLCSGFLALRWEGVDQNTTFTSGTAPNVAAANGYTSLSTSAMPLLPAGTQHIALRSGKSGAACVGFQTARLDAVVLDN